MKLATIARIACTPFIIAVALMLPAAAHSQSVGDGVSVVSVNDWGSGHIATFQYIISADDLVDGIVRDWRIEVGYGGAGQLTNAYMSGYSGSINSGNIAPDGGFAITNEGVGYRPELSEGFALTFNLQ